MKEVLQTFTSDHDNAAKKGKTVTEIRNSEFKFKKTDSRRVLKSCMALRRTASLRKMSQLWRVQKSYTCHALEIRIIDSHSKISVSIIDMLTGKIGCKKLSV